jgi:hypothetical protein
MTTRNRTPWDRDRDRDDGESRYLRHREDDLRSVGSPGIGGGTGGYRDMPTSSGWGHEMRDGRGEHDESEDSWSPPQSGLERSTRGWGGGLAEGGGHAGKGPSGYTRSDARIHEDVCDGLTDDDHVDASAVDVKVEG